MLWISLLWCGYLYYASDIFTMLLIYLLCFWYLYYALIYLLCFWYLYCDLISLLCFWYLTTSLLKILCLVFFPSPFINNLWIFVVIFATDLNECLSNPCAYGSTCIDGIDSYSCLCPPGRSGSTCSLGQWSVPSLKNFIINDFHQNVKRHSCSHALPFQGN